MSVSLYGNGNTIIQAVSVPVTNAFTSSSNSMVDITSFSATITPQSTTSKILVLISLSTSKNTASYGIAFQPTRNGAAVGIGTLGTTAPNYAFSTNMANASNVYNQNYHFVDSPASTSALTYKLQVRVENGGGTFSLNNNVAYLNGGTDVYYAGYASNITLLEISGS